MGTGAGLRVLVAEKLAEGGIEALAQHFTVESGVGWSRDELLAQIAGFDAIVVRSATKVDAELIDAATNLKVIGRAGTGVDNVDVPAATRRGIIVCNAAGSNSLSAAEHTIALLLAQARNVAPAHAALVEGRWERSKYSGIELEGKTLGVVGFGRIGQMVAERALGLGMKVVAYDPFVADSRYRELGVDHAEAPADLYAVSDFVTLHLASTPDTRGFLDAEAFAAMKAGARVINVARGDLVDNDALAEAITSGHLAGAGVDVFPEEPCIESPLFGLPGVVVTPHLGASTAEAQDRAGTAVAEQVVAALTGGVVSSAVNIPAVGPEALEVLGPFIPLAERMGQLAVALAGGVASPIHIGFEGDIANVDTRMLCTAVIAGALTGHVDPPVNIVNATALAEERGIEWVETTAQRVGDYRNVLRVRTGDIEIEGTTVGVSSRPRIVRMQGHAMEIEIGTHMAVFEYSDVPGMIGRVGTILGDAGVNVAGMAVDRRDGGAMMVLNVDSEVPREAQERITNIEGFESVWFVTLPDLGVAE
ncbi:MAG: phosphoglycerate dehydrogenase [Thermoleophilia bacterium]